MHDGVGEPADPFFNEDHPGATEIIGWADAWDAVVSPMPSRRAEMRLGLFAAAQRSAREHGVRLVVREPGTTTWAVERAASSSHLDYNMRDVVVHDDFRDHRRRR